MEVVDNMVMSDVKEAEVENFQKGRSHFQSKNLCCTFWEQGFLIMKLKKIVISGFRVYFFNNCIEKNQNKTHFEEGTSVSLYYLAIRPKI